MDDEAELSKQQAWARDIAHRVSSGEEVSDDAREQWLADKARLKRKFGELYPEVLAIIQRHDPIGIAFVGDHEYDPELGTILLRLEDAHSEDDLRRIVYEEFVWWFSDYTLQTWQEQLADNSAGSEEKYREIAHEIWLLLQRKGASND